MADMATTAGVLSKGSSLLDRKMKKSSAWISGVVVAIALLGGLAYIGFHVANDLSNITVVQHLALCAAGSGAIDRTRIRVRQRLP